MHKYIRTSQTNENVSRRSLSFIFRPGIIARDQQQNSRCTLLFSLQTNVLQIIIRSSFECSENSIHVEYKWTHRNGEGSYKRKHREFSSQLGMLNSCRTPNLILQNGKFIIIQVKAFRAVKRIQRFPCAATESYQIGLRLAKRVTGNKIRICGWEGEKSGTAQVNPVNIWISSASPPAISHFSLSALLVRSIPFDRLFILNRKRNRK